MQMGEEGELGVHDVYMQVEEGGGLEYTMCRWDGEGAWSRQGVGGCKTGGQEYMTCMWVRKGGLGVDGVQVGERGCVGVDDMQPGVYNLYR